MGKENLENTAGTVGKIEPTGTDERTENGSTGNNSTDTTRTTGAGTGKRGRRPSTRTTEGIKNETTGEVPVLKEELPEVNIPSPAEKPVKQKRKYTKKNQNTELSTFNAEQLSALIVAMSSMIASREGFAHWMISEPEAKQIAEPLAKIIAKNDKLSMLGEHADAFALVTACIMIFAPRIIMTFQMNKAKKGVFKNVAKPKPEPKPDDRQSNGSSSTVHRKNANAHTNVDQTIFSTISPIQ